MLILEVLLLSLEVCMLHKEYSSSSRSERRQCCLKNAVFCYMRNMKIHQWWVIGLDNWLSSNLVEYV